MPSYSSNPLSRLRTSYPRFTKERNDFYLNVPYEDRDGDVVSTERELIW